MFRNQGGALSDGQAQGRNRFRRALVVEGGASAQRDEVLTVSGDLPYGCLRELFRG